MSNKIFKQAANRERGEEKAQSVEKTWIITLLLGKGGVWYYVSPHMCRKVTLMLTFQGRVRCSTLSFFPPSFCAFGCTCGSLCGSLCVSVNQAAIVIPVGGETCCPPHDSVLRLWNSSRAAQGPRFEPASTSHTDGSLCGAVEPSAAGSGGPELLVPVLACVLWVLPAWLLTWSAVHSASRWVRIVEFVSFL